MYILASLFAHAKDYSKLLSKAVSEGIIKKVPCGWKNSHLFPAREALILVTIRKKKNTGARLPHTKLLNFLQIPISGRSLFLAKFASSREIIHLPFAYSFTLSFTYM